MGPLAQAQRAYFKTEPYRQTLGDMVGVAQLKPDVLDNYNWDFITREMAKGNGIPEEALVEEKTVAKMRAARAQQAAQAAAVEKMKTMGQAVPGLNQPVEQGASLKALDRLLRRPDARVKETVQIYRNVFGTGHGRVVFGWLLERCGLFMRVETEEQRVLHNWGMELLENMGLRRG